MHFGVHSPMSDRICDFELFLILDSRTIFGKIMHFYLLQYIIFNWNELQLEWVSYHDVYYV